MIYLDNASTTQIDPAVLDVMMPYLTDLYGNAGTIYKFGGYSREAIERAREQVAALVNADPRQIIFTSGGTESNNMVMVSSVKYFRDNNKYHIITSQTEHDSVLKSVSRMSAQNGFTASYVGVNKSGEVGAKDVEALITPTTGLVSIMYVNNETGTESPVKEIGEICAEKNTLFHTDCVQAASCCKIDVEKLRCDFLSLSSHKIHGPKGVGALYVRDPKTITPMIVGGAHQEYGLRGGTENVAGIVGFGKACEITKELLHDSDIRMSVLKQLFYNKLREELDKFGLADTMHLNGHSVIKHGKILNIEIEHVDGETLLLLLSNHGVCVSAGSACNSMEQKPSHVLTAMGIDDEAARNSIRVSFSRMNSESETLEAASIFAECAKMAMEMSCV